MTFKYTWLILRKSLNIFEIYLCSKKTEVKKKPKQHASTCNLILSSDIKQHQNCVTLWIKYHQWRGNNECQALGCWSTPSMFWLSFWITFIVFFQLFVQNVVYFFIFYLWNLPTFKCLKKNAWSWNKMFLFTRRYHSFFWCFVCSDIHI